MPFNTGSTTTAGETMKFYLKLQSDSDYKEICVTSLGEELAYNIETWYDFCGRGSSSSAPTGIDVTISAEMMLKYNEAGYDLFKKRYDLNSMINVGMKIEDEFTEQEINCQMTITSFSSSNVSNELRKVSFELKPFAGTPIVTDLVPTP